MFFDNTDFTPEGIKKGHFDFIDITCKQLAQSRRMAEIEGVDVKEFDDYLNECCAKWARVYDHMDQFTLAKECIEEILTHGDAKDILGLILTDLKGKGEDNGKENR